MKIVVHYGPRYKVEIESNDYTECVSTLLSATHQVLEFDVNIADQATDDDTDKQPIN